MIQVEKLSWSFPQKDLFENVSFTIEDGQHCALIGSNGTGKTTLADMIVNPDKYLFRGKIISDEGSRYGYVSQFVQHEKDIPLTVYEFLCADFVRLQQETERICAELETAEDFEQLLEDYQRSLDEFQAVDGDNYEVNVRKQLAVAGLSRIAEVPVAQISGGEYKLLQIIRRMLSRPTVLVMDEPDVFLDFDNISGLRDLINNYSGTMLVVTHSRYLLNSCFNKILHLENGDIQEFDGTYIQYNYALLQSKVEDQTAAAKDQDFIEIQEALVERLRDDATEVIDPARGRMLHARVSYLERLKKKKIKEPFVDIRHPAIRLPEISEAAQEEPVLTVRDYAVSFDEELLSGVSFEIRRGETVALIGSNGTGKTTMLRDIFKGCPTVSIQTGHMEFLSQTWDDLPNGDVSIMSLFREFGFASDPEVCAYLRRYCFEEDELYGKAANLSGGERNLLQLARIALTDADLLLLDEPTSHLDTYAQLALEDAVKAYKGTVLMVSHDFYTVANTADFVLYVENGTVRRMSGRAFRKMIYKNHFSKEYLEIEQQRRELEVRVNAALKDGNTDLARELCEKLEPLVNAF